MKTKQWYRISAKGQTLGRLASRVAVLLMGKDKPDYTPHEDNGAFIIVTDAKEIIVSGNKRNAKEYFIPSRYPGNSRAVSFKKMQEKKPDFIIQHAVKGMLPKNKLADKMIKRLKIYTENEHPHGAHNPAELEL